MFLDHSFLKSKWMTSCCPQAPWREADRGEDAYSYSRSQCPCIFGTLHTAVSVLWHMKPPDMEPTFFNLIFLNCVFSPFSTSRRHIGIRYGLCWCRERDIINVLIYRTAAVFWAQETIILRPSEDEAGGNYFYDDGDQIENVNY